jgi:uncharacterized protein YrzB (UPF0473 family)
MDLLKIFQRSWSKRLMETLGLIILMIVGAIGGFLIWQYVPFAKIYSKVYEFLPPISFRNESNRKKLKELTPTPVIRYPEPSKLPEPPKNVPLPFGGIANTDLAQVKDENGKETEFKIYVFPIQYNWKKGEIIVELNGEAISEDMMVESLSAIYADVKKTQTPDAIVCVGTASYDVQKNEANENDRGLMRSLQLVIWMRMVLEDKDSLPMYALNLGHYKERKDNNNQRLVIIISIRKIDEDADIEALLALKYRESLKTQLREQNLPFNLDSYVKFELLQRDLR